VETLLRRHRCELTRYVESLDERRVSFKEMRDGLHNDSSLLESWRATKQGNDVGILTNMTVLYLPFSLVAGVFSLVAGVFSLAAGVFSLSPSLPVLDHDGLMLGMVTFSRSSGGHRAILAVKPRRPSSSGYRRTMLQRGQGARKLWWRRDNLRDKGTDGSFFDEKC
jgi:hypothetical protein